jgi:hypothetical protein
VNYSCDVVVEGKPVCRRLDPMVSNIGSAGNTPPAALMQANVAVEGEVTEGHVLALSLQFEHPNTISRRVTQPLLNAGYHLEGPEAFKNDKREAYVGLKHIAAAAGSYSLKLDFDRKKKPLESDKS